MVKPKERVSSIQFVLVLLMVMHFCNVEGCSKSTEKEDEKVIKVEDCPEYVCNDNKKCYTKAQQCDGSMDCEDGTDEDNGHCGNLNLMIIGYIAF